MPKNSYPAFRLEIVTPYRVFYADAAEMLVVNTTDGHLGIMRGHLPMVTILEPGPVRILREGEWMPAAVGAGYMEVTGENTYIIADSAEWPDEIDEARAQAARERAEERLRKHLSRQEYIRSQAAVARALARLTVKKNR